MTKSDERARTSANLETSEDRLGANGDDFYVALLDAHSGLSEADSTRLNARLILLLANEVGDIDRLKRVIGQARSGLGAST